MSNIEPLWTAEDVAKFLGVKRSTVYRLRKEGGLPVILLGGTIRFNPESVRRWAFDMEATGAKTKRGRPESPRKNKRPIQYAD